MSKEYAGPQGMFEGPESNISMVSSFQIQVTNAPYFGTGPGAAYVGINSGGYCFLTTDQSQAATFAAWTDSVGRRFISTPNGWLSYSGSTPYYIGSWVTVSNAYQTWIENGIINFSGITANGVMCFFSDGSNTWLYNQVPGTPGYVTCTVLPVSAP